MVLQGGSFESATTQKTDFPVWPGAKVPQRRPPQVWISRSGQFDGTTTNRSDYSQFPLPPKFHRKPAEYVKTDIPLMSVSTQVEDYKKWDLTQVPHRYKEPAPYLSMHDDR